MTDRGRWVVACCSLGAVVACAATPPQPARAPAPVESAPPPPTSTLAAAPGMAAAPAAPVTASAALASFLEYAGRMGATCRIPAGYQEVPVRKNMDVGYNYAVASADGRVEIRFALRPYDPSMPPMMLTRDFSWMFFMTGVQNLIHGGHTGVAGDAQPVPAAHFAADDARMVAMRFDTSDGNPNYFSNGYEAGVAIFVHRDHVGDVYTFLLFRDRNAMASVNDEATFHSLRFLPRPGAP